MKILRILVLGLACVVLSVAVDALFLPHQSLWNDEGTQLAGIALKPVEVTRWLAGWVHYDLGFPDDRMPPGSYIAGWTWTQVFGLSERSMRWFGVCCVALATGIVYSSAARAWGIASGIAAALLLATSPNVIVISVEIRAYPILLLASSALFACLIGYADAAPESRVRWLIGMVATSIMATYVHFFGLVALGAAFLAAFVVTIAKREKVLPVVVAGGLAGFLALGLEPFVFASTKMSPAFASTLSQKLIGLVRLIYRWFGHPSTGLSTLAVAIAGLGMILALGCGLARKTRQGHASIGLAIAMVSGFVVVSMAHLAQSTFSAASETYNIWMLPPLFYLMASGLAAEARVVRLVAFSGILMLLGANAYGASQLIVRGDSFAHNPHRRISGLIRRYKPGDVAVIHDNDGPTMGWMAHGPLRYDFGDDFLQVIPVPGSTPTGSTIPRLRRFRDPEVEVDLATIPGRYLIVIRSKQEQAKEIAAQLQGGIVPLEDGPITKALLASGAWERVEEENYLSLISSHVIVLRKVSRP